MGRGRMPNSQSTEIGFEVPLLPFLILAISFSPQCPSSLSCLNEYLAIDCDGIVCERIVYA